MLCFARVIPQLLPSSCGHSKLCFKSPFCVPPVTLRSVVTSLAVPDVLSERQRREAATLPGILAGLTPSHRTTSSRSQQQSSPQHPPPRSLCCTPHFTGPAPLPAICSGSFSPNKLSERQLVCLPPLRRDYLRQKEDGRCLATAGHLRNVMSVSARLWTTQSPRPSSEETLLDPEGLLSQERGSHE